jgi:hypothetical protein
MSVPLVACWNVESVIVVTAESAVAAFSAVYMALAVFSRSLRVVLHCAAGTRLWRFYFCLPDIVFHTL